MKLTRTVFLSNLEVMCSIGLHDFEQKKKQRVLISIELRLDAEAEPQNDDVAETLDYDEITAAVLTVAEMRHFDLQETLARKIFDALAGLRDVVGISVMTDKPDIYPHCESIAYRLSNLD